MAPWRRKRLYLAALLVVLGSVVVTCFGYTGHTLVTTLYSRGVPVVAETVSVATDADGRTTDITVRFRPTGGADSVTAELPTSPPLPRAVEGRPIEVVYDSHGPADVLSTDQLHRLAPDGNPMVVAGFVLMALGPLLAASTLRRT